MRVRVGFSTSQWWVSRVILRFTGGPCSHAFLYVESELGSLIFEAGWDGWRVSTPEALTRGTTRIVSLLEAPPDRTTAVVAATVASRAHFGEAYDYEGLLGMAWVSIAWRWLRKKVRNPLRSARSVFCSDAIVQFVLQPTGWPGAAALDAQSVSPAELQRFLLGSGAVETIGEAP